MIAAYGYSIYMDVMVDSNQPTMTIDLRIGYSGAIEKMVGPTKLETISLRVSHTLLYAVDITNVLIEVVMPKIVEELARKSKKDVRLLIPSIAQLLQGNLHNMPSGSDRVAGTLRVAGQDLVNKLIQSGVKTLSSL